MREVQHSVYQCLHISVSQPPLPSISLRGSSSTGGPWSRHCPTTSWYGTGSGVTGLRPYCRNLSKKARTQKKTPLPALAQRYCVGSLLCNEDGDDKGNHSLVPSPPHPSFCLAAVEKKRFSTAARQKLEWGGLGTRLGQPLCRVKTDNCCHQVF